MTLPLIATAFLMLIFLGYNFYGRWVANQYALDDSHTTPAHKINDGVDFVPTKPFYLFAQHFSAIAAAGPIAGPILACMMFGWLPCLLWISFGVIFIGAMHDFSSLTASVRHGARNIADVTRERLGAKAGIAMLAFIWISLMYVIIAFTDITAASFVSGTAELEKLKIDFNPGGAVAAASIMYLLLGIIMGLVDRYVKPPLWLMTIIFVPATFGVAWLGTYISTWLILSAKTWGLLILVYCAIASVLPVWLLLQPRGYLGGFVLYSALAVGIIGIFFGGYEIKQDMFKGWQVSGMTGLLFPFLFVTIACGACSGFHGLVCSGTTSKQVDRESHMRPVGYGAMLAEGFVAVISLATVMVLAQSEIDAQGLKPATIYGNGIGQFLTILIGKENLAFAVTFGAMAFSTFVFDTLDVGTRLGRYIVQELLGWRGRSGLIGGTFATMALPVYFIATAEKGMWTKFWTLFGSSNQLLAALTLLTITVWLYQSQKRITFVMIPMLFVLTMTLWSLITLTFGNLSRFQTPQGSGIDLVNSITAAALIVLALYLAVTALIKVGTTKGTSSLRPAEVVR
jgi:carbon starvation protein